MKIPQELEEAVEAADYYESIEFEKGPANQWGAFNRESIEQRRAPSLAGQRQSIYVPPVLTTSRK